jgi:hypothetical protein
MPFQHPCASVGAEFVHLALPQRKTPGRADRYSFPVRLLHSLLHAGLSRRTRISLLVHHCATVPVHHIHRSLRSLPQKMQSESSGGNLRLIIMFDPVPT